MALRYLSAWISCVCLRLRITQLLNGGNGHQGSRLDQLDCLRCPSSFIDAVPSAERVRRKERSPRPSNGGRYRFLPPNPGNSRLYHPSMNNAQCPHLCNGFCRPHIPSPPRGPQFRPTSSAAPAEMHQFFHFFHLSTSPEDGESRGRPRKNR